VLKECKQERDDYKEKFENNEKEKKDLEKEKEDIEKEKEDLEKEIITNPRIVTKHMLSNCKKIHKFKIVTNYKKNCSHCKEPG
jgi:hypothetical protein